MSKEKSLNCAFLLDGTGGGTPLGWEDINRWEPSQGVLWVHLNYKAKKSIDWLNNINQLDLVTARALVAEESRPRCVPSSKGLLLVLRGVNLNPGQDPEDMVSIRIWMNESMIITTCHRKVLSIDDIKLTLEEGHGPKTSSEFLRAINEYLVDRMSDVLEELEDRVDGFSEQVVIDCQISLRSQISDLRRECIMIRRYLAPQREALNRLHQEHSNWLSPLDKGLIRETLDRVIRYVEDLDSARERATIAQEELMSRLSEQLNQRMYVLSVVSIIFLPLSFVTGLWGVNVAGIPGQEYAGSFMVLSGLLFGALLLMLLWFKKQRWL